MEFEGVVYKILPLTQGTSARGEWQRQDVVFEPALGIFTQNLRHVLQQAERRGQTPRRGYLYGFGKRRIPRI